MFECTRDTSAVTAAKTALGAQTWLEVACFAHLCGRLPVEPT
jgi:hypothetical protein